jgi:peptide/nickel transport system substrate-binding protein
MKQWVNIAIVGLMLAAVLESAVATGSQEGAAEAPEQEVTMALSGAPGTLDPHKSFNGFVFTVTNQIYETLLYRSADGSLEPRLATSWEMVDDTTYELRLRENVTFHDGTPFDAQAVKYSLERLLDPETQAIGSFIITMVEGIEVVDDMTVRITTDAPFAPLPAHLSHPVTAIVSPAVSGDDLAQNPVGTGPFAFDDWIAGNQIDLVAFDEYWGGEPTIERVVFRVIPEVGTQVVELQAGTIDLMSNVPPERFEQLSANPDLTAERFLGWGSVYLGYNVEHPILGNPDVRRAIALALDRNAMIETLRDGMAQPADTMLPETVFGSEADVEAIPYDPDRARSLLSAAVDETPVALSLNTFETAETRQIATAIQSQLSEIGIELEVEVTDFGAFSRATSGTDHGLWLTTWGTVTLDADYTLYALLHSSQHDGDNRSRYADDQVDEWLQAARRTADAERRRQLYEQVHEKVHQDLPYLTLYYPLSSYAKNLRLEGEVYGFSPIVLDLRTASIR